jgi:hypothetical protein
MRWFPLRLVFVTLMITGCTNMCGVKRAAMTPEQVVEGYLNIALNMKDVGERDKLIEYTTGNLRHAIESASVDTIKTAYIDRRYQILNYSVVERKDRTPRETEITFQLTYNDLGVENASPQDSPKVTTENTVSVIKANGLWMIRDVLGNKTSIDFPVSAESRISARPGPGIDEPMPPPPPEEPAPEATP